MQVYAAVMTGQGWTERLGRRKQAVSHFHSLP
jgi:hypothetical protein